MEEIQTLLIEEDATKVKPKKCGYVDLASKCAIVIWMVAVIVSFLCILFLPWFACRFDGEIRNHEQTSECMEESPLSYIMSLLFTLCVFVPICLGLCSRKDLRDADYATGPGALFP